MEFSERDIRNWLGSSDAHKGDRYQQEGRVSNLRKSSEGLGAQCQGSQSEPYSVRVRVDGDAYRGSTCSCPLGGECKHAAAVLYEFVRSDGEVPETHALVRRLLDVSHERLAELAADYAERHPDFSTWLEIRLTAEGGDDGQIDREEIRRRVDTVVSRAAKGHRYGRPREFDQLDDLVDSARQHLRNDAPQNAADIFGPVARGVLDRYHWFDASGGGILDPVMDAADGLVEAFGAAGDELVRSKILHDLWDLWRWDVDFGGIIHRVDFRRAFVELTDDSERRAVADWSREVLDELDDPNEGDSFGDWTHRRVGGLLLDLEGDDLSDDELRGLVERTGLRDWWARELLERGEVEEAASVAKNEKVFRRLELVEDFRAVGALEVARKLLKSVVSEGRVGPRKKARNKLVELHEAVDDWEAALEVALDGFEDRTSRQQLEEVERLARKVGRWEDLEPDLLDEMTEEAPGDLIWYYLSDDDPDAAVAIWEGADVAPSFDHEGFAEEIADTHPDLAVELLDRAAVRLIDARGRDNYRRACEFVGRIRDILGESGQSPRWRRYRDDLLDEYSNLPAFQDEMQKADLAPDE